MDIKKKMNQICEMLNLLRQILVHIVIRVVTAKKSLHLFLETLLPNLQCINIKQMNDRYGLVNRNCCIYAIVPFLSDKIFF